MIRPSALLSAFLALSACSGGALPAADADVPRTVPFVMIEQRTLSSGLSVSGRLVSREEAAVASQVGGYRVARVLVDQDDPVKAGQPLALLDDTLLRADINQQRAALAQARVAIEKADSEAGRVAGLDGSGVLSDESIAQRRLAARTARATLDQARAQLSAQLIRQSLMVVRAPASGRILTRSVRPGDVSSVTSVMFTIGNGNEVELDAEIPEQMMGDIHVGDAAMVTLASGAQVEGHVRFVSAQVDESTRLGRARIRLPARGDLRPGGFASAAMGGGAERVSAVPEAALSYNADGASISVIDRRDMVRVMRVVPGKRSGGYVELREGPPVGTRVLSGSQDFVLDGDKVTPRPAPSAAKAR